MQTTNETKRLCDSDGDLLEEPRGYSEAVDALRRLIDNMEKENIDRADMSVVIDCVFGEMRLHKVLLSPRRQTQDDC